MVGLVAGDLAHVRLIANLMRGRADYQDLVSDGALGLVRASLRYEEGRGAAFRTFAEPAIRGAMIDGIRERRHTRSAVPVPPPCAFTTRNLHRIASGEPDPLTRLVETDEVRALRANVAALRPVRIGLVLSLYFFGELSLRQVAALVGITEARACQLKNAGLRKLRAIYRKP